MLAYTTDPDFSGSAGRRPRIQWTSSASAGWAGSTRTYFHIWPGVSVASASGLPEGLEDGGQEDRGERSAAARPPRTAVRNLVNAGVAERVAMTITGHKTRDVFDRDHIVSPTDLKTAVQKARGHNHGHNRLGLGGAGVDGSRVSL
jgi:hypothetical protein